MRTNSSQIKEQPFQRTSEESRSNTHQHRSNLHRRNDSDLSFSRQSAHQPQQWEHRIVNRKKNNRYALSLSHAILPIARERGTH